MKSLDQMGKYPVVVIDPPWDIPVINFTHNNGYTRRLPYKTMSIDEIKALPVADVLDDEAFVFCWTTNRFLRYAPDIIEAWGLHYIFTMTWVKSKGPQVPNTPRFNAEYVVVGRKGNPQFREIKGFRTANMWKARSHSEKPEEFYDLLRRVTDEPRLDIFGRRSIAGFDSWGDEAPDVTSQDSHYQQILGIDDESM